MSRCSGAALLLLGLMLGLAARAEWVEIPQFSDQEKVYKLPAIKFPAQQQSDRRVFNVAPVTEGPKFYKISFQQDLSLRNISEVSDSYFPDFPTKPQFDATLASFTTDRIVSTIAVEDFDNDAIESVDETKVESEGNRGHMSQFDKPPSAYDMEDDNLTSESLETVTKSSYTSTSESPQYLNETNNDKGFLDYLPIDLLKRVHKTLKSQPPTLKGKIRFLKLFEKTLLEEIESRLSLALAPTRKPRGARDHDGHDDGIGFPSLEGTLMAISFLTFAVYLVRLVMMLFRSANNNNPGTPILIGRKRRSIDDFNEETARILSYLDTPLSRQY